MSRSRARKKVDKAFTTFDRSRIPKNPRSSIPSSLPATNGPISGTCLKYERIRYRTPMITNQNRTPSTVKAMIRPVRARPPLRERARAVSHFGERRRTAVRAAPGSAIEDTEQLFHCIVTSQPQENVFQPRGAGDGVGPELIHGPAGANAAAIHDGDAVAHGLGDFERVRGH